MKFTARVESVNDYYDAYDQKRHTSISICTILPEVGPDADRPLQRQNTVHIMLFDETTDLEAGQTVTITID